MFFHGFYGLLLSFSLRPTTPLESVQQFFYFQADTEQYAITGPIFQAFCLNYQGEMVKPADRRMSGVSFSIAGPMKKH
jgi:hypothetical protein